MKWTLTKRHSVWVIKDSDGQDVCYIDREPAYWNGEHFGSITSRGRSVEHLARTARLIASAPEILAALKKFAAAWESRSITEAQYNAATELIVRIE